MTYILKLGARAYLTLLRRWPADLLPAALGKSAPVGLDLQD